MVRNYGVLPKLNLPIRLKECRSFTKFIIGIRPLSYEDMLKIKIPYSVQRRFERYTIIFVWKILESMVPNLSQPITYHFSDRRGCLCYSDYVSSGRIGTLSYNSFRWRATRLFNCLPRHVRNMTSCSTVIYKKKLDLFLLVWMISHVHLIFIIVL